MKHILVIDDDQHIGDLLQEALTKQGYRVSRAYSGTEALLRVFCEMDTMENAEKVAKILTEFLSL